ncbi:MAG: hypothetical protein HYW08_04890 [candidate division NC10 bacterium]|nr:hypothetical protein [candidate division NC10 bacterium]MBI4412737.1 hypothetical protein [candidate division NC10 bacterium]
MTTWHAAFWCALAERDVEVEFVRGSGGPCGVKSCSVFAPQTAVSCHRRCLDPAFRREWQPALPASTGWETGG